MTVSCQSVLRASAERFRVNRAEAGEEAYRACTSELPPAPAMKPAFAVRRTTSAPVPPALSLEELMVQLALPVEHADRVKAGERFVGRSGLSCLLAVDTIDGVPRSAKPTVLLGLHANELAGNEVAVLMTLQASLLSTGLWLLCMADDGELQVTCLRAFDNAREVATALELANVVAWSSLHMLLDAMAPVEVPGAEGEDHES